MASITETRLPSGWQALCLQNDAIEVVVLPEKGSEIYTFQDRGRTLDVLWKAPWGLRPPPVSIGAGPESAATWLDHYAGGWQVLFPNAGDACTQAGAPHTFHGEASVAPWQYTIEDGAGEAPALHMTLRCARSPFHVEKRVSVDPVRPVLRVWERITNVGAAPAPYMWGQHPAFGAPFLAGGCRLDVPAATYESDEGQDPLVPGPRSAWPHATVGGITVDLSQVPGPEARTATLGYLLDLREGWYALRNPSLGVGFGLVWPQEVFPCLWLWRELCGSAGYPWYGTQYVMGVEPHTSHPGHGLATALERGTARWLQPGEQVEMAMLAVLFEDNGPVSRISPDGTVTFAADGQSG